MTRFIRIGACGAVVAVALAACGGGSLNGPLAFSPASVLAVIVDSVGQAYDGGRPAALVTLVMSNPAMTCQAGDAGTPVTRGQVFTMLLMNLDGGISGGNSYALGGIPFFSTQFGFAAIADGLPDGGSASAATYSSGDTTIRVLRPDRLEGSFDIDGTTADGGTVNLKGDFSTSTICKP